MGKKSKSKSRKSRKSSRQATTSAPAPDESERLPSSSQSESGTLSDIAISAIEAQLENWRRSEAEKEENRDSIFSLFGVNFNRLYDGGKLGENVTADCDAIISTLRDNDDHLDTRIWTWTKLPYTLRCAGLQKFPPAEDAQSESGPAKKKARVTGETELVADIDEWILRNEAILRSLPKTGVDTSYWKYGLVRLQDLGLVFPTHEMIISRQTHKNICLKVPRPSTNLPGFTILENKRRCAIYLQPDAEAFQKRWNSMTRYLLNGLNWANVFVAGGTAFGALVTPCIPSNYPDECHVHKQKEWKGSDIDLYIYGLSPELAIKKIEHIADVYRKNLPEDAPFLVVRNSQTITLYSQYPLKRVQIVLKLMDNPRDVLLNFDLDICAVGFDGTEAWILPRCARALETGLNVFTMDLITGHYLGDRKATREARVFKYANKGYGIRFLPSYLTYLSTFTSTEQVSTIAQGECLFGLSSPLSEDENVSLPYSLATLKDSAVASTKKCLAGYLGSNYKVPEFSPTKAETNAAKKAVKRHTFSHAMFKSNKPTLSELLDQQSCLSGFSLFMRHVGLWEEEAAGKIIIGDTIRAESIYREKLNDLIYDDTPGYAWDSDFILTKFEAIIGASNERERSSFRARVGTWGNGPRATGHGDMGKVARRTCAPSIEEIFSSAKDIVMPLILERKFVDYANSLIRQALEDKGHTETKNPLQALQSGKGEIPVLWYLDQVLNWQMLDRRIDEVHEVLWILRHANGENRISEMHIKEILLAEISRRDIRATIEDEMDAFVRWVGKRPVHKETKIHSHCKPKGKERWGDMWGYGSEEETTDDEYEEEEEAENEEDEDEEDEDDEEDEEEEEYQAPILGPSETER